MAEVQTPLPLDTVSSVKEVVAADKNVLIDRLDALLEQYLNTLDEYEKLMQQLSKQLSSVRPDRLFLHQPDKTNTTRPTSPSHKPISTIGQACTMDKTATINVSRQRATCVWTMLTIATISADEEQRRNQ